MRNVRWLENAKSGIIVALVVAILGVAVNERAKVLDITYQNARRIEVLESWQRSFVDYPWSRKDLQESIVNSVKEALDPRLKRIEDRIADLDHRAPKP